MADINTDGRILSILRSGEAARQAVDPDELVHSGRVSEVSLRLEDGSPAWSVIIVCTSGDSILLKGIFGEKGIVIRHAWLCSLGESIELPVKQAGTLVEAFGNLSELPDPLKKNLAFVGQRKAATDVSYFSASLYYLTRNALFHRVIGGGDASFVDRFSVVRIRYDYTSEGVCFSARLSTVFRSSQYTITVSACIDVYAIKNKRVSLEYCFGQGRSIDAECYVADGNCKRPSVNLAFDIAGRLSGVYVQQRTEKKDIGRPVGKKVVKPKINPHENSVKFDVNQSVIDYEQQESVRLFHSK